MRRPITNFNQSTDSDRVQIKWIRRRPTSGRSEEGLNEIRDYQDYPELPTVGNFVILVNKGIQAPLTTKLPNYPFS